MKLRTAATIVPCVLLLAACAGEDPTDASDSPNPSAGQPSPETDEAPDGTPSDSPGSDLPGTPSSSTSPSSPSPTSPDSTAAPTDQPGQSPSADPSPSTNGPSTEPSTTAPPGTSTPTQQTPVEPTVIDNSRPARARKSAVPKAIMPGFNPQWTWTSTRTSDEPHAPTPGVCMVTSFVSIGAVNQFRTDYGSNLDQDATATVLTAVLPNTATGRQVDSVLSTWQRKCGQRTSEELGFRKVKVTPTRTVQTSVGPAYSWLVTYRPVAGDPQASWYNAEGWIRDGDTVSYVVVRAPGTDYNYRPGQAPIDQALRVAADRLLRSRP